MNTKVNQKNKVSKLTQEKAWIAYLATLKPHEIAKTYQQQKKDAWIAYLEQISWNFFVTGSTRYELTSKSARRLAERWYKEISSKGSMFFYVSEPFEVKEGQHIHGLLKVGQENPDHFRIMIDMWQWATGNRALSVDGKGINWDKKKWNALNLRNYDPDRGAGGYMCKYVMKTTADYDLLI